MPTQSSYENVGKIGRWFHRIDGVPPVYSLVMVELTQPLDGETRHFARVEPASTDVQGIGSEVEYALLDEPCGERNGHVYTSQGVSYICILSHGDLN